MRTKETTTPCLHSAVEDLRIRRQLTSVGLLAAATLLLETTLTRWLAVAQFYHFAFLVISLALLGFGASGALLARFPRLKALPLNQLLGRVALGFVASVGVAYATVNLLPFDSYAIAWDRRQIVYFFLYYLALTLPFLASGLGTGAALSVSGGESHRVYAASLVGSGLGVLAAPLTLALAGVPGAVIMSAAIGWSAVFPLRNSESKSSIPGRTARPSWLGRWLPWLGMSLLALGFLYLTGLNFSDRAPLGIHVSPYKGLAQARRSAEAQIVFSRWNAISRLDVIVNAGTHRLPGLSYLYQGALPPQAGLSLDAGTPWPLTLLPPAQFEAGDYLPESLAFALRSGGETLVLEPGAGLGVLQALRGGSQRITAVVNNPLLPAAIERTYPGANPFTHPRVVTVVKPSRAFLRQTAKSYDLVFIPLTGSYRPVASGAFSLAEEYLLTRQAYVDALRRLRPEGLLVTTRWLQTPPSESIRLVATLVESLEKTSSTPPEEALVLYRGIQTMTFLVKPDGWSRDELQQVREFATARKYDLVWAPDLQPSELNRYNRLSQPVYHQAVGDLLDAPHREVFYRSYAFNIRPPEDDRPFFHHFFTWAQTPAVLAGFGRTWQPFGGSGYLVLIALLLLVTLLSFGLILLPLISGPLKREIQAGFRREPWTLAYFALIGFAFLLVEIPLIQRAILLLGDSTLAFAAVVFPVLVFSGLGSVLARKLPLSGTMRITLLVFLAFLLPFILPSWTEAVIQWPSAGRLGAIALGLAPLAFFMGLPFPLGLAELEATAPNLIPLAWGINGFTSVIASVLAAILALGHGFTFVLLCGAVCYAGAGLVYALAFKR